MKWPTKKTLVRAKPDSRPLLEGCATNTKQAAKRHACTSTHLPVPLHSLG